ncbi:MAG: branched-chain amino acid ABC transporter permease [Deltaproteobacteria bacterium]|nr:branched-chain amino acid ABC transporter permease [Deltaproteobacteria bacterium]
MTLIKKKRIGLIILAFASSILPLIVRNPYYIHILIMVGINAILAMTFILMLRTGLISIAIAVFWGVGAYSTAMLSMKLGLSFWLSLPLGALITGIVALFLGLFLLRNAGFTFIILTMALGEMAVLAIGQNPFMGGYQGLVGIPAIDPIIMPFLGTIEFSSKVSYYYLMLCLFWFVVLVISSFYAAWVGRAWSAIGLKAQLAESLGINLYRYRLWVFVFASSIAGLAGGFYAHYYGTIEPATFGTFKTIYVHIMAVLGGIGFPILGPVVGAFILTYIPEILRIAEEVEPIITGFCILFIILFMPDGILGFFDQQKNLKRPAEILVKFSKLIKNILLSNPRR